MKVLPILGTLLKTLHPGSATAGLYQARFVKIWKIMPGPFSNNCFLDCHLKLWLQILYSFLHLKILTHPLSRVTIV